MKHIEELRFGGGEDDEFGNPTSLTFAEVAADQNADTEGAVMARAMREEVRAVLETVPGDGADLLRHLYGIGEAEMTLEEIAVQYSLTVEEARALAHEAMEQLRTPNSLDALGDFRETNVEALTAEVTVLSGLFHGLLREELRGFKKQASEEERVDASIEAMLAKAPYTHWRAVHAEAFWNGHIDQIMAAYDAAVRPSTSLSRENAVVRLYNRLLNHLITPDDEIDLYVPAHFLVPPDHFLAGVRSGTIRVHGDVGNAFAEGAGGDGLRIYLDGNAGDWAGNGLADGTTLAISGNTGTCAAANDKGATIEVFVRGDVGHGAEFRSTEGHLHVSHESPES